MALTSGWLSGIIFPLIVFFVGQAVFLIYGDRIKTWAAQRSVEKMNNRIQQLQDELTEAYKASQSLTPFLADVANGVYIASVILPAVIINILLLLILVFAILAGEHLEDSRLLLADSPLFLYLYAFLLLAMFGLLFIMWFVFYSKSYRQALKSLRNAASYDSFKIEVEKTIIHLEGRIKRFQK